MKHQLKTILIIIGLLATCIGFSQEERPEYVSMVSLISAPERYEGKLIKVRGYFFDFSRSQRFLYNNREDFKMSIFKNSIWVYSIFEDSPPQKENTEKADKMPLSSAREKHVTLVGRFRQNLSYKISSMPTGIIECLYAEEITASEPPKPTSEPTQANHSKPCEGEKKGTGRD